MIHGDLFQGDGHKCPLLSVKTNPMTENPFGTPYQQLHKKFEALKVAILEKYKGTIDRIVVEWSCDFQRAKRTWLKSFIETLPLPPKYRLIPRDGKCLKDLKKNLLYRDCFSNLGVRGGRTDSFVLMKDASADTQLYYKDASEPNFLE